MVGLPKIDRFLADLSAPLSLFFLESSELSSYKKREYLYQNDTPTSREWGEGKGKNKRSLPYPLPPISYSLIPIPGVRGAHFKRESYSVAPTSFSTSALPSF